ncbi:MAG: carboxypeptidase-like regulatory domain-containing protein, partial [Bacteroidota bacterium]
MKRSILLSFAFFPILLFSQKTITTSFQNLPLQEVLIELEQKHKIIFSYTSESIENQLITADVQNQDLKNTLALIFQNTSIDYEIVNETYVILKRKELNIPAMSVCGTIVDEDQIALPFANVFIKKNSEGMSTDEDGKFEWQSQILPNDTIEISYVGFKTKKLTVKELERCPIITLKLQTSIFSEVMVKEYITAGIEQSEDLNHLVLRPAQLDVVPGLTEADVLQMVQILPGVQSPDESATGLHIRGGTPDQNLILWDGIPIYNNGHFFGMLS